MKRIDIEYETQPIINKPKKLQKITLNLFVDWTEYPQNTPVNGTYFNNSTNFIFDNNKSKGNKNVA